VTKLSDTQAILLSAAAQRRDGNLLPLPGSLRGGAATKVVGALLARGFAREDVTDLQTRADSALNTVWRNEDDGRAVLLKITTEGLEAIGVEQSGEPEAAPIGETEAAPEGEAVPYRFNDGTNSAGEPAAGSPVAPEATPAEAPKKRGRPKTTTEEAQKRGRPKKAREAAAPAGARKTRDGTKQAQVIAMLRRKEGATIAQIIAATGWQPHTVRGAFAGALKKKLGLTVTSEKVDGTRVYRLPAEAR
jgi:Protein of unknown function (DUF3489)